MPDIKVIRQKLSISIAMYPHMSDSLINWISLTCRNNGEPISPVYTGSWIFKLSLSQVFLVFALPGNSFNYQKSRRQIFRLQIFKKKPKKQKTNFSSANFKKCHSVDPDDVAHFQDLCCLQIWLFSSLVLKE